MKLVCSICEDIFYSFMLYIWVFSDFLVTFASWKYQNKRKVIHMSEKTQIVVYEYLMVSLIDLQGKKRGIRYQTVWILWLVDLFWVFFDSCSMLDLTKGSLSSNTRMPFRLFSWTVYAHCVKSACVVQCGFPQMFGVTCFFKKIKLIWCLCFCKLFLGKKKK